MRYPFVIDGIEGRNFAVEVPIGFGAPTVLVDGQPAPAGENPREFLITLPDGTSAPIKIVMSQLGTVLSVAIADETVALTKPLTWYEWAWNGLPFLLVAGGGVVGGMLGGAAAMVNLRLFRAVNDRLARYALTAATSFAALLAYLAIVGGINLAIGQTANREAPQAGPATAAPAARANARPVASAARSFALPQDWSALREAFQAEITGADSRDHLTLQLGRIPEPVSITVPAGVILRPVSAETRAGACVTRLPDTFSAAQTAGTRTFSLSIFNADATRWDRPGKADAYAAVPSGADDRLRQFLQMAVETKLAPNLAQTGVWVLRENISAAQFSKNRLFTNTYDIDFGRFVTTSLANYGGIRKLRLAIQAMGVDPTAYQLFQDYRAELEKVVQRMDFEKPQVNWDTVLANGSLETYAGEPEIEAVLLQYATRHTDLAVRESALKSLLKIRLTGEPAALLQQVLTTASREHRFLAAHALATAGDLRGQPVLALFAEDPSFAQLYSGLKASIQAGTKLAALPEETALAFWERAMGWEALQKQYGDVEAIRRLVTNREAAANPWLDEYLGKLRVASDKEAPTLLSTLEQRYKNNPRAFGAVQGILLSHPKSQVRVSAGRALVNGWKQAPDLRETVVAVMEKDPDHQVVSDFLRHALVFGKMTQPVPLIQAALTHRLAEVRAAALTMLANDRKPLGDDVVAAVLTPDTVSRLSERDPVARVRLAAVNQCLGFKSPLSADQAEAILLRVAAKEPDKAVRSAALTRLCETKSRNVLPILKRMLAGSKEDKNSAISLLDRWKNDPETLALLESVRQDPDVGRHAVNVLKRYGR